jgi:hypothetical protein
MNVVEVNEIKKYLNCRYVYALETTWRIFKFDMHERFPAIEHLQYHLPNQQMVLFNDNDDVEEVAARSTICRMMLTEWFKTNQESKYTQSLMFYQFPHQWVWNWKLKDGQCIKEALPLVACIMHTRHQVNVIICESY